MLNDTVASNLIKNMKEIQKQYLGAKSTNPDNLEMLFLKIQELQKKIDDNNLIKNYYQANKDYEKLLKNVYNTIDYLTGRYKLNSLNNGCCSKCC